MGDDSDVTTGDAAGGVSDGVVDETGSDVSGAPVGGLDWRKQLVAGLITLAVLVVVFVGIFPKFANYGDAWASIQQMSIGSLVALGLATLLNIVVYVFPYMAALPGIRFRDAFVVRQTSFMISNAVPAGGAFGLGVQYAMLAGYRFTAAQATSAIAVTSVWNMLVTLALHVSANQGSLLGADSNGRDMLSRIIWGTRSSFIVGFGAVAFGLLIGGFLGLITGFFRGKVDGILTPAMTILLAIPQFVLALSLVTVLASGDSTSSTRRRVTASDAARLTAVVVLPTPPFWLATAMIRPMAEV